jgi:hypothetical protein
VIEAITRALSSEIFYNAITAIATIAYTIGTFVLVTESRKQRKAQLRPQIDMYMEPLGGFIFYATVKNVGLNPARNIRFSFDADKADLNTRYMREIYDIYSEIEIPHLSPGREVRHIVRANAKDFEVDEAVSTKLNFLDVQDNTYAVNIKWNLSKLRNSAVSDEVRDFYKKTPENLKKINDSLVEISKSIK